MNKKGRFLDSLTARRFKEFTLPGAPHRQIVPVVSKERVPVGHRVWRNICRHGARGLVLSLPKHAIAVQGDS